MAAINNHQPADNSTIPEPRRAPNKIPGNLPINKIKNKGNGIADKPARKQSRSLGKKGKR